MFGASVRRSSTLTRTPRIASSQASIRPVGPAPTTATSVLRIAVHSFACGIPSVTPPASRRISEVTSPATSCRPTIGAVLYGRERECAQVDQLLAAARERRSEALVVRGEAGIGKSALLDYAAEHATGLQMLRTAGIQTESQLPFAAVHNMLLPVLDRSDPIPERQKTALLGAFGLGPETAEDRFLISLAVLSILAETAETAPLLCLIDDAEWLDGPSADALTFAARRVQAEGIVILFAARDDPAKPFVAQGLPELRLTGLDPCSAGTMLAERTSVAVAAPVRDRLAADTLGNPLALAELARSLSADQLSGRAPLPDQLPVSTDLERLYLERAAELPSDTQAMLLVAAAHDNGQLDGVLRAAELLGVEATALDKAETSGLLRVDSAVVSFVHPLVRSAIYRGAPSQRRQDVERALAAALDADTDAEAGMAPRQRRGGARRRCGQCAA
jgi:predicted ATPase